MASIASSKAFLGVGWNFPLAHDAEGQADMAEYEEDVRQAILIILMTGNGERLMRPTFGAGLNSFAFEPINPTTMAALQTRVEDALIDWEPRIDVIAVSVRPSPDEPATVLIDITYRVRATNSVANLVYPFYLGEGSSR
jgi:phage baseplate assembly protein W